MPERNHPGDPNPPFPDQKKTGPPQLPFIDQQMLHNIFMQVPALICVLKGPDLIYEFANEYYRSYVRERELIGKKAEEVLPELVEQGFLWSLQEVYKTNKPFYIRQQKTILKTPSGGEETYYLDLNYQVYYDKDENNKRLFVFGYDVTEEVKARKLISIAEKKFRDLFYHIPTPLYTCDPRGRIILYNDALVQFCSIRPTEQENEWCPVKGIYNSDGVLIPKAKWPQVKAFNKQFREGAEVILELNNGTRKNVMYYPKLILDENGEVAGVINTIVDVTQQVNARRELEIVAKVIEDVYTNAPAFICTLRGADFKYELVNPAYQQLFGKKVLTGKLFLEVSPELKEQGLYKMIKLVYKTGRPFVATEQLFYISRDLNSSPEVTYLNFSIQPVYDSNKKITGVVLFGYDVTELVEARQKGVENVKSILESLPQITSISSANGTNIYFNKFFFEYSGLSREEASTNGWNAILHPDEKEVMISEWEQCKEEKRPFYKELRLRRQSDGIYRWHIVNLTPVKNKLNRVIQWIASATDIHEQKTKEEKKDEFLSIASHELKTPLTTVKAYLQLLEFSLADGDAELKLFAEKAIISVDRLRDLISELLDVSKIQQHKLNLNIAPFDFDNMVQEVIDNGEFYLLDTHKIIRSGDKVKTINGDKERLSQVINNLLSNAIKYSPEGGDILFDIRKKNNELKVSVIDKGIGIASHNLERIFERYFRVNVQDIHFQGLGIGLFISMEIIRQHRGKLWAESSTGIGSTFHFSIPLNNKAE